MCRALTVLCAAPDRERLSALKGAAVSAHWELVGGALTVDELVKQLDEFKPDVVVVDATLGPEAGALARDVRPGVRVVSLGSMPGADVEAAAADDVRAAVLGIPPPGGPVRV